MKSRIKNYIKKWDFHAKKPLSMVLYSVDIYLTKKIANFKNFHRKIAAHAHYGTWGKVTISEIVAFS